MGSDGLYGVYWVGQNGRVYTKDNQGKTKDNGIFGGANYSKKKKRSEKRFYDIISWLGWRDSNPRMPGPKPGALPLGDIPTLENIIAKVFQKIKRLKK